MIDNKTIREHVILNKLLPCEPGELTYIEAETAQGNTYITFTTNVVDDIKDLYVDIVPKQSGSGDPSPDNIRPITGVNELKFAFGKLDGTIPDIIRIALGETIYGGEVECVVGEVTSDFVMVQVKTLNWTAQSNLSRFYTADLQGSIDTSKLVCCEFAKGVPWDNVWANIPLNSISVASSGNVFFKTTDYTDKDTFLAALGDYYICYPLATPTTAQITPVEIKTFKDRQKIQSTDRFSFSLKYPYMTGGACNNVMKYLPFFYDFKGRRNEL